MQSAEESRVLANMECTCFLFVRQSAVDQWRSAKGERLMQRTIAQVSDGFTVRGVAQFTAPCTVVGDSQRVSNKLGCWTVYCSGPGREYSPRTAERFRAFSYGRPAWCASTPILRLRHMVRRPPLPMSLTLSQSSRARSRKALYSQESQQSRLCDLGAEDWEGYLHWKAPPLVRSCSAALKFSLATNMT